MGLVVIAAVVGIVLGVRWYKKKKQREEEEGVVNKRNIKKSKDETQRRGNKDLQNSLANSAVKKKMEKEKEREKTQAINVKEYNAVKNTERDGAEIPDIHNTVDGSLQNQPSS